MTDKKGARFYEQTHTSKATAALGLHANIAAQVMPSATRPVVVFRSLHSKTKQLSMAVSTTQTHDDKYRKGLD